MVGHGPSVCERFVGLKYVRACRSSPLFAGPAIYRVAALFRALFQNDTQDVRRRRLRRSNLHESNTHRCDFPMRGCFVAC